MADASRDQNFVPTLLGVSNADGITPVKVYADPTTHRLLTDNAGGGSGTVTDVSVVTANGFAGTVATSTTTPAITLTTTITGVLKGNGTAISAASASTDYAALAFKTIAVSGQSDVVADSPIDTLTLVGSGITITTDAATDTITFTGGASVLTVGTTTITSGTNTRILYDNSGVLGEYTLTGTGTAVVMANTPTLITPVLGVATATSINKMAITAPATGSTLAVADGKTLTASVSMTLQGGDASVLSIAAAKTVTHSASTTFAGTDGKTLTITNGGTLAGGDAFVLAIAAGKTLTVSNTLTFTGTDSSSVAFGTGGTVLYTASTIPLTVGSTTIASGTNTKVLFDNAGVLGEYTISGSGNVAMTTSPVFTTPALGVATATSIAIGGATIGTNGLAVTGHVLVEGVTSTGATGTGKFVFDGTPTLVTPVLGVATATSINKVTLTAPASGSTLTIADGKTLTVNQTMTLTSGGTSSVITFPNATDTVGGLGTAQTWTAQNKFNNLIDVNNAVTVTSNAGTVPVTFRLNTFTNSSAATMAITMATASAVDGQMSIVRIYDSSAVAQTIGWTNTENSNVTVPTTSNGSTTLPLTVGFMYNGATSKWRCIASA